MTGYSGMSETAVCQRRRYVRDGGMSETAACQWWSLEGRGGAAGEAIRPAFSKSPTPAGSGITVHQNWTAVDTLEKLPTVGRIDENLLKGGTRD